MVIQSAKTIRVERWIELDVMHAGVRFKVTVQTVGGKLKHEDHKAGLATSRLIYFSQVPEKTRAAHYKQIKNYVERYFK